MNGPIFVAALAIIATIGSPAVAKTKNARPAAAPQPTCARASYPGDPVCDADERGLLPTPSSQSAGGGKASGFRVDDRLSVNGKSDFNANRYGGTMLNNPSPNPRAQDVNGGGAVNYKF